MPIIIDGGCATDIGISRSVNQDAIFVRTLEQDGEWFVVGAVCDGIGGLQRGEAASGLVINGVAQWFSDVCQWIDIKMIDPEILYSHLKDAAEQWNNEVIYYCERNAIKSGTTMSIIMIIRNKFYILQVGDSRIYRYGHYLEQLTTDATALRVRDGKTKSFLDNFMGKSEQLWFTSVEGEIQLGDIFLFCSDGFYHKFTNEDMQQFIVQRMNGISLEDICKNAIYVMENRRETDNISVGLITVKETDRKWKRR